MGKALKQLARVNHYTALSTINTEIHQKKKKCNNFQGAPKHSHWELQTL